MVGSDDQKIRKLNACLVEEGTCLPQAGADLYDGYDQHGSEHRTIRKWNACLVEEFGTLPRFTSAG